MKKQKVLQIHNYYQLPGGEDTVVANEKRLLEENGHQVIQYTRHNSELNNLNMMQKLLLPFSTVFNLRTYREVRRIIREEAIDIVHVHNTLNLVSPSVYYAAVSCGVPVVQTVHNFRLLCPGATFYRDGQICEACLEKGIGCALKHRCYRSSLAQTLACVVSTLIHRSTGIYKKLHYICLTEFNKEKLLRLKQLRPEQISIKPNFVKSAQSFCPAEQRTEQIVFVGRLEKLKGVDLLLETWRLLGKDAPELLLCGTGPLEQWCAEFIRENDLHVTMKGFVPNEAVRRLIGTSRALILPTQCYETFPMTIVEAYAAGTPVITGNMGNAGNLVDEGMTGLHYIYDDAQAMAAAVRCLFAQSVSGMYENARDKFARLYNPEANYACLAEIYDKISKK